MLQPKICCEHKSFTSRIIAKIIFNISINQYGFIHIDNSTTIFYDSSRFNLLCYDVPDLQNGYSTFPITYSSEWLLIQNILNNIDTISRKLDMITIFNEYSSKFLSIIDAILTFPLNCVTKCVIISNIFVDLNKPIKLYTSINNEWIPFCVLFGNTCNYLVKVIPQRNIMTKLINHFVTTKMDKNANIMCTSEQFTAFILFNKWSSIQFTILMFNHNSEKFSMYPLDTSQYKYYSRSHISHLPFDINEMYGCVVLFQSSDNTHKLTKENKRLLISKIIESLSKKMETHAWNVENNDLFY